MSDPMDKLIEYNLRRIDELKEENRKLKSVMSQALVEVDDLRERISRVIENLSLALEAKRA